MSVSETKPAERATEEDEKKGGKKGKKEEEQIAKYRQLLQSIQDKDRKEKDKDMEMEITWVPGMSVQHGTEDGCSRVVSCRVVSVLMCVCLIFLLFRVKGER